MTQRRREPPRTTRALLTGVAAVITLTMGSSLPERLWTPRKGKARTPEPWWIFTTTEPAGRYGPRQCSLCRPHGLINHLSQAYLKLSGSYKNAYHHSFPLSPSPELFALQNTTDWAEISPLHSTFPAAAEVKEPTHCFWQCVQSRVWSLWILCHVVTRQHLWLRLAMHPTYQWDSECLYLRGVKTKNIFSQTYHESSSPGMACWLLLDSGRLFFRTRPQFQSWKPHLGSSGTGRVNAPGEDMPQRGALTP